MHACLVLVTYLRLFNGCVVAVAHGRDVEAGLPLLVALPEELLHYALHPVPVELQRLRRVGEVGAVDHVLQDLDAVVVVVEGDDAGAGDLLGLDHGLEVGEQAHVLGHVGGEDHVDDHLAEGLPLLDAQAAEDITVGQLEELEGHGEVVVLQHGLVVVEQRQLGALEE